MLVIECKLYGSETQFRAIDEGIRVGQFVRNKALRYWMDEGKAGKKVGKHDLNKLCAVLAAQYPFVAKLGSQARQAAAERAWSAIARFYERSKKGLKPIGYPRFQKDNRSIEYKQAGWKLDDAYNRLTLSDGLGIGTLKLKGYKALQGYNTDHIKRVRILKRADGYYAQFCLRVNRRIAVEPSGTAIGLDVGLTRLYTDSNGNIEPNPRFYRKAEKRLKRAQKIVSRRHKRGQKQSHNYLKAKERLARVYLKTQRQRRDHAIKLARCVVRSNDLIAFEDLSVKNMVRNRKLAKSIYDAGWRIFRQRLEYYGKVFGNVVIAVDPKNTTQIDHESGSILTRKTLADRVHLTASGREMSRDHNAAINILQRGLQTVGWGTAEPNAWRVSIGPALSGQETTNQESHVL
ncbi:MAG: transposase [Meiothermus sp.]|nr:MAG: transposase [Meiothermus sp.]